MSNIIKGHRAVPEEKGLIIDSNSRVNEVFKELWEKKRLEDAVNEDDGSGFVPGLIAPELTGSSDDEDYFDGYEDEENEQPEEAVKTDIDRIYAKVDRMLSREETALLKADLHQKSEELMERARVNSERILVDAAAEADANKERVYSEARDAAYAEASERAEAEYQEKVETLEAEHDSKMAELQRKIDELEPQFAKLVIRYVEKLTGILSAEDYETVIYHSIDQAINDTSPSKYYKIHVPKEQFNYMEEHQPDLKASIGQAAEVEILADPTMKVNQCSIETDKCVIDCSLETRLNKLTNSLRLLSENREVR